jgi:hypothetical protein
MGMMTSSPIATVAFFFPEQSASTQLHIIEQIDQQQSEQTAQYKIKMYTNE